MPNVNGGTSRLTHEGSYVSTTRRRLLLLFCSALLSALAPVHAQQPGKVWRIGVIWPAVGTPFEALRQAMRELGYVEGRNISFEYRGPDLKSGQLSEVAKEFVASTVDAIVTLAPAATFAAKEATRTIPIVFLAIGDPLGSGLVASLARPGGNLTGISRMLTEISVKHFELLREVVPGLQRVAVLWNPANSSNVTALKTLDAMAQSSAIRLQSFEVREPSDLDNAFAEIGRAKSGALLILADPVFGAHLGVIAIRAQMARMPAITRFTEFPEQGGLIGYSPIISDEVRQAARLLDKVLKGAKPGELPVEQPTKFELVVNVKTAKALGIKIPQSVLLRADRVIE